MCENVVGPICLALEQFADETASLPAHRFRPPFVRLPWFSGVGFLFTSFSQAFKGGHFKHLRCFMPMHWAQYTAVAQSMPD
jgi:hypothetical protein